MNWIKQNRFLAGFLLAMLIGVAVLGYLLFTARSNYVETQARYDEQSSELNRLLSLAPYPAPENVVKLEAQRKEHQTAVVELRKNLASNEIPLEEITEARFQDRLRESVTKVTAKANERGIKLPEGAYMGFAVYEAQPPRPEAAPALGRQLKAIELVVMRLLDSHVSSIDKLERPLLPEETEPKTGTDGRSAGPGARPERGAPEQTFVTQQPFQIEFTAPQPAFRTVLNALVSEKTQFYIPRLVEVTNEKAEPPKRGEIAAVATPPPVPEPAAPAPGAAPAVPGARSPAAAPAPGTPPALPGTAAAPPTPGAPGVTTDTLQVIVGRERVKVSMRVEIVDFAEPPAPTVAR